MPTRLKKFLLEGGLFLGGLAAATAITGGTTFLGDIIRKARVEHAMHLSLEEAMEAQEKELGIQYSSKPSLSTFSPFTNSQSSGEYHPWSSCILLRIDYPSDPRFKSPLERMRLTLDHELGHFYTDIVCQKLGIPYPSSTFTGRQLSEGIADYFMTRMHPEIFLHTERGCEYGTEHDLYCGGYWRVKPFLDEMGVEKGVEHLLTRQK